MSCRRLFVPGSWSPCWWPRAARAAGGAAQTGAQGGRAGPTLLLAPEDLRTLALSRRAQGPVITGSIQPERRADLRAEVSAVVLQVLKENGEPVRTRRPAGAAGRHRRSATAWRSAEEAVRAVAQAFEQAERQVQRLKTLQAQGMTSMQALEDAEVRRNNAQSELVAAKARVVSARQQLRAPRCARRSTAWSASARSRPATPRRSARSWSR